MRAEVTADNTSIRVSWQWSPQGIPMCVDLVRVDYRPEGGSLMMYTVNSTTATSATLPNLQCNTKYTVWVHVESGSYMIGNTSTPRKVSLATKGTHVMYFSYDLLYFTTLCINPAPPTPTNVAVRIMNVSSVRVTWRWTSSGSAPNCFNTTSVTYRPEGGGESFLQLSNPAATVATLTDLQCNTNYTVTVVAIAGEHRRVGLTFISLQGIIYS